jgi:hypothetical protein
MGLEGALHWLPIQSNSAVPSCMSVQSALTDVEKAGKAIEKSQTRTLAGLRWEGLVLA